MSYELITEKQEDLVKIVVTGERNLETAKEIWDSFAKIAKKENVRNILVLDKMETQLEIIEIVELGNWFKQISFPIDLKVAIVDPNLSESSDTNLNAFGEDVIQNRGWFNIQVFPNEEPALAWLKKSET